MFSKTKETCYRSNRARLELTARHMGRLEVNGNLMVHQQLSVSHIVQVNGSISAGDIDVGGRIQANAIKCNRMRVGGRADVRDEFEAASVDVGGKVISLGMVKLGDLRVGGEVEVGGGSITGNIRVGGKFSSKSLLEFNELLVYGKGSLPAGCKGHKVSTFGKLEFDGDLTCDYIEASGFIEIMGNCHAEKVEVGGKLQVNKSLTVSGKLESYGLTEVNGDIESIQLHTVGKLVANKVTVKQEADISGKLETIQGLKAKQVTVRSGGRCDGILIGELVEVGKSVDLSYGGFGPRWGAAWAVAGGMAKVDDIYAIQVVIGQMSRARSIFADIIKLEQCSFVRQVTYTQELKVDPDAKIDEPPRKVDNLPKPPF